MTDPVEKADLPEIPTQTAVLDRIRAYAKAMGWTGGKLASEAGLSRGTLGDLFDPAWRPTSTTVFACEAVIPADWRPDSSAPIDGQAATTEALAAA